jgi:N-acetylglucosaminyldiphosphoundecaprenol N-acetyl-beta-D-mannosaminyltransferase
MLSTLTHSTPKQSLKRDNYKLLGVEVNPLDIEGLLDLIRYKIETKERLIIASQNLHSIYTYHKNDSFRLLHQNSVKRIDGMAIVFFGKMLGYPLERAHRVTWVDLIRPLMQEAKFNKWKVFYLGADEESVSKGVALLRSENSGLEISYRNGFFNASLGSQENENVIEQINHYAPDLLIVGMGMPRQEEWILNVKERLNVSVIMTCGAAIEYVAGTVKTPPRWMGKVGLEWFYRLAENPKRFWFRYLIEPWFILYLLMKDTIHQHLGKGIK